MSTSLTKKLLNVLSPKPHRRNKKKKTKTSLPSQSASASASTPSTSFSNPPPLQSTSKRSLPRPVTFQVPSSSSSSSSTADRDQPHPSHHKKHVSYRHSALQDHQQTVSGEEGEEDEDEEGETQDEEEGDEEEEGEEGDEEGGESDEGEEEYTIKDRQEDINYSHPFGVRLWKPALYKKDRSIDRITSAALHSTPKDSPELYLYPGNIAYALVFGWWLSLVTLMLSFIMFVVPGKNARSYARVLLGLAGYIVWPFGRYVERIPLNIGRADNERALEEGEQHQSSDGQYDSEGGYSEDESSPFLGSGPGAGRKNESFIKRIFDLGIGGLAFYLLYFTVLAPLYLFVSACCWFLVFSVPMAKLTYDLSLHLRQTPLRLCFKRGRSASPSTGRSTVLLCNYRAMGSQYYKYTIDGTNIIFINLMGVVAFVLVDAYLFKKWWGDQTFLTNYITIFALCLASTIPLAYFIGQGVSSISAQSSLGMGAVINATFGSIVEVILYSMALSQGKGVLVEGSIIGSFLGSLLLLPGLSMFAGGIKRKEQKFNAKSAGVTSTMLIFSVIGVCTPTLFYSMYGKFEIKCSDCLNPDGSIVKACKRCFYDSINPLTDEFFLTKAKPLMYICACILPLAYLIGLWFTLRTHVTHIYSDGPTSHHTTHHTFQTLRRDSFFKRLIPFASRSATQNGTLPRGTLARGASGGEGPVSIAPARIIEPPTNANDFDSATSLAPEIPVAATATASSSSSVPRNGKGISPAPPVTTAAVGTPTRGDLTVSRAVIPETGPPVPHVAHDTSTSGNHGGHDAPNWSKAKSAFVLFACTVLFSAIAEILVDSVDSVVENMHIDEKFLGLTMFALVPNVTEFMNAISFAMYNNIALSMEIGSAYAVQVALLQIPSLVAVTAFTMTDLTDFNHMFTLIFPRWDVITVLFAVFLLTYVYIEGKSNYFKGSMLILAYTVLIASFFFGPPGSVREGGAEAEMLVFGTT